MNEVTWDDLDIVFVSEGAEEEEIPEEVIDRLKENDE